MSNHPERHLEAGYAEMAGDVAREAEALEWAEAILADVAREASPRDGTSRTGPSTESNSDVR